MSTPTGSWIQEDDLNFEINEPDAYALEEALQLKEKNGGEVIALCAGPARAAQTIREALAKGADRAIHIEDENLRALDPLAVARLMAKAHRAGEAGSGSDRPAIGRPGLRADRRDSGGTARSAARDDHHAGGSAGRVDPRKAGAGRWLVPACGDAAAGVVDDSIGHQQAALRHADGHQEGEDEGDQAAYGGRAGRHGRRPRSRCRRIYVPERAKQAQIFEGPPKEAAAKLVEKLKFEARVI